MKKKDRNLVLLQTKVPPATAKEFRAFAKRVHLSPATALRQVIMQFLEAGNRDLLTRSIVNNLRLRVSILEGKIEHPRTARRLPVGR